MSRVSTDFGIIEYEPAWLEQKLEEYLISEQHPLPAARRIDMSDWPRRAHLCRYLIGSEFPFDAVIYNKELDTEYHYRKRFVHDDISLAAVEDSDNIVKTLAQILGSPKYLREEVVRFVLVDGVVILRHEHNGREICDDNAFSVSWGGGDLSTCPRVVRDQDKRYDREGTVLGKEECLYALNAVVKEGGLF
jgi:hypothetical protein